MAYNPDIPYNDLPLLLPEYGFADAEIMQKVVEASRKLAELKGLCSSLPDPALLINTIMLQESRDSSAIENIVTTQDELYQALTQEDTSTGTAKEVLRYREALYKGLDNMRQKQNLITTNTLVEMVQGIKQNQAGIRNQLGTVLKSSGGKTVYTPPCCEDIIREKLSNLEIFINDENFCNLDPLIKLAIIHYQFEAIHPFSDGNGRTGRILNTLYLVQKDLLPFPVLYLSAHINEYKSEYYRLLREVTEKQNWKEWCLFILYAVAETAQLTIRKIKEIQSLMSELQPRVQEALASSYKHELYILLFSTPYLKIELLERNAIAHRETASKYLKLLVAADILQPSKKGKTTYFINHRLMKILTQRD
jgi:Fic family protein